MKKLNVSKFGPIKTVQEALALVHNNEPALINVGEGVFKEKLSITFNNLTLIGQGIDKTIITYDDYSKKIHEDGRDYNTFRTPSVLVLGDNCTFKNLTIANTTPSAKGGQALALSVLGNRFKAEKCKITSQQDTLFLGPLPDDLKDRYFHFLNREELFIQNSLYSKFIDCVISGDIDYIFGCGSSLFSGCDLISVGKGYVAAPSHSLFQTTGFIFDKCNFINNTGEKNNTYIARPWRPFGKITLLNCKYEDHIMKVGFTSWNNKDPLTFNRFEEFPMTLGRVNWLHVLSSYHVEKYYNEIQNIFDF